VVGDEHSVSGALGRRETSSFGRVGGSAVLTEAFEDVLKALVRLGAQHEEAAAEDVSGDGVDADRFRIAAVVIDHRGVAILIDRPAQLRPIQTNLLPDPREIVRVLQPCCASPVRFEQRLVHLIELSVLAGELGGAQRAARVDDDVTLLDGKPDFSRDLVEVNAYLFRPRPSEVRLNGNPLEGSLRVKLERPPLDANKILPLQLLDSDRVDVAPGSNVVREDDQLDRLGWRHIT